MEDWSPASIALEEAFLQKELRLYSPDFDIYSRPLQICDLCQLLLLKEIFYFVK